MKGARRRAARGLPLLLVSLMCLPAGHPVAAERLLTREPAATAVAAADETQSSATSGTDGRITIFEQDFETGGGDFYNYVVNDGTFTCIPGETEPGADYYTRAGCRQYLPSTGGYLNSRSPYWVDPNHKFDAGTPYPGVGFLNIVGFLWHGVQPLDLTDARMTFRVLLDPGFDFKGGHLSFWFQSACTSRPGYTCEFAFADYVVDIPIEERVTPGTWTEVTLVPQESNWQCLGAQTSTQQLYGCMPIADALARVENIGFMIVPVPIDPDGSNSVQAAIKIDDIHIWRPQIEQARWIDTADATATGGTLTRSAGTGWSAGATSSAAIVAGDGFAEMVAVETNTSRVFGLARGDSVAGYEDIDFGIGTDASGVLQAYELGVPRGAVGQYVPGDRLRVDIESGVVRYRRNGVTFYTSAVSPTYPLRLHAALHSSGATIRNAVIAGHLAENVNWTNAVGVTTDRNDVTRTAPGGSNAGVASLQAIPSGDGFVDFSATGTGTTRTIGLSTGDSSQSEEDIDFGIRLTAAATVEVVENGVARGTFGTYAEGDRLRVVVEEGVVHYLRNGSLLYTSDVVPAYPLGVDVSLSSMGATLTDVVIRGAAESVTWTNVQNLDATTGQLSKTAASEWDAGASSTRAIVSGDGFVEFTVADDTTSRAIGFNHRDASVNAAEIDFAFAFEASTLQVTENGALRFTSGYAPGDRMRIAIEGGVVRYFRNGTPIYTSAGVPHHPLVVDASIFSAGTVITNVIAGGNLGDAAAVGAEPPVITVNGVNLVEGDSGTLDAVFALSLSEAAATATTVQYYTAEGTAVSGQDYTPVRGTVTFTAGQTSRTVSVPIVGDAIEERREAFVLVLASPVNGQLAAPSATGIITDTDGLWTQVIAVTVAEQTVTKTSTLLGWNAGASSMRSIASGDGFVEFTAAETNTSRIAGLTNQTSIDIYWEVDFGIMLAEGLVQIYEAGTFVGSFGGYAAGDHFRVSAVGGVVRYWWNDRLLWTSTRTPQYPLRAATALYSLGATVQDLTLVTAATGSAWDTSTPSPVEWTNAARVSAVGDGLTKVSGTEWDAGASSTVVIHSGSGYMEFTAAEANTYRIAGLSKGDADEGVSDIAFGILLTAEHEIAIYESGEFRGVAGYYAAGDRLRVSVGSRTVRYWKNGALLYTSTKPPSYPMLVDTSLFTLGATVADAVIAGSTTGVDTATWVSAVLVTPDDADLTKTGATGWNGGAASKRAIRSGDGFVEFSATATNQNVIAGLGSRSSAVSYEHVDFGILLTNTATVAIYETGNYVGAFGAYAAGDRFRVSVAGNVVTYWRNGTLLYSSARAPGYPLRALAALFENGATVSAMRLVRASDTGAWDTQTSENVVWKWVVGAVPSTNNLTKTSAPGWNAGGVSTRMIALGDGYMEFTVSGAAAYRIAGLSGDDANQDYSDVSFGLLLTAEGQVLVYENGTQRLSGVGYVAGDVFRVSVADGIVRYWQNANAIYTSTVPPTHPLMVDTALYSSGVAINQVKIAGTLQSDVTGWTAVTGATVSETSVTKQAATGWNAGAVSKKTLRSGDGFMEFVHEGSPTHRTVGLTAATAAMSYGDLDFGLLLTDTGTLSVYEGETHKGDFGSYASGDRLRITVAGGKVRYWRNDTLLYTSARVPSYPLRAATAMFTAGATISEVRLVAAADSGTWDAQSGEDVTWTDVVHAAVAANSLSKSSSNGWSAGAVSNEAIEDGDGFMEFTATELSYRAAGLSKGNSTASYEDIDFGVLLTAEGNVAIYEGGEFRGSAGWYVAGDRFRVSVAGHAVRYWRNGVLLYTSTKPPSYPLRVDTSIFSNGGTITEVTMAPAAGGGP